MKSVERLQPELHKQLITHWKISHLRFGLLLNHGCPFH
ncbi:MAG: GxxExxY protein [Opitutales bacterium]